MKREMANDNDDGNDTYNKDKTNKRQSLNAILTPRRICLSETFLLKIEKKKKTTNLQKHVNPMFKITQKNY